MFAEEPETAVREARRVLRDGGSYVAITWDAREANAWLGLVLDAVGEQFGVPFPPPNVPGPFSLSDPGLLADTLGAGGLRDVDVVRMATPMRRASLEAWWELVPQLAGPLALALARAWRTTSARRSALERSPPAPPLRGPGTTASSFLARC